LNDARLQQGRAGKKASLNDDNALAVLVNMKRHGPQSVYNNSTLIREGEYHLTYLLHGTLKLIK